MLNGKYEQALLLYNNHCINKEEKSIEDCEIIFRVGCIHLNIGEYLQAQDCFHNALTILKIPFCNRKSGFLFNIFVQMIYHFVLRSPVRYLIIKKDDPRKRLAVKILNKYSYALYYTDISSCFYPHFLALNISRTLPDCTEKMEISLQHAVIAYRIYFKYKVFGKLEKIFDYIKKTGNKSLIASTKAISGILHYYRANWKDAEDNCWRVLENLRLTVII